jgi:hypothetical protein
VPTTIERYIPILWAGSASRRASYGAPAVARAATCGADLRGTQPRRHNGPVPRFWIAMQIVIVICVIISAVIVVVKL